jgi:hypothetical protein
MEASDIITRFEEYVDDSTELSSDQELALLQKVYNKIWNDRPWEFAKASVSGTFALTTPNIPLPDNFANLLENNQTTSNADRIDNNASPKVIFVGSSYAPFQVVNWSDRRQYRTRSGFAYLDLPNNGITFSVPPTATDTYEFDFQTTADILTLDSTPAFPERFHDMLYHGMAVDHDIILLFPRASSYAQENQAKFDSYLQAMALWNANLQLN